MGHRDALQKAGVRGYAVEGGKGMNGVWYSVKPTDVLPASDEVCHFRVQKAHEDSCIKLTKGMRFIWMVTPELEAENPKVGKRHSRWTFLECKRIVYARRKWWRF